VYQALEKGVVDGLCMSPGAFRPMKLLDLLNYHTIVTSQCTPMWVVMNWDAWNSLSPEAQAKIDEMSPSYWQVVADAFDGEVAAVTAEIEKRGQELIYPSDAEIGKWRDACKWTWDEWVKTLEAKGLPAQKVLDATMSLVEKYK